MIFTIFVITAIFGIVGMSFSILVGHAYLHVPVTLEVETRHRFHNRQH